MEPDISPIIKPKEAVSLSDEPGIIIVDARTGNGKLEYQREHLAKALYVDLDTELADIKPDFSDGGRHPLPTPREFCSLLNNLGITPTTQVLIYDDKSASNAAARFWWMLRSIGHKKAQVIDGGIVAAIEAGFPVSSGIEHALATNAFYESKWELPLADLDEVERASHDENFMIIDVRDKERFDGEKELIDLVAGHIPGAVNIPFTTNLDQNGLFLPPEKLKAIYSEILSDKKTENVIVHCGSGVTACHTLLALEYAGFKIPKLYVGSWSEWSGNNKPIATTNKQ